MVNLLSIFKKYATVRIRKGAPMATIPDQFVIALTRDTRFSGTMREITTCPSNYNQSEWIAYNIVSFYDKIRILYTLIEGWLSDTPMTAGTQYEYRWLDMKTRTLLTVCAIL